MTGATGKPKKISNTHNLQALCSDVRIHGSRILLVHATLCDHVNIEQHQDSTRRKAVVAPAAAHLRLGFRWINMRTLTVIRTDATGSHLQITIYCAKTGIYCNSASQHVYS